MRDNPEDSVRQISSAMAESAAPFFARAEIEHLACLVRLTVEFHDLLGRTALKQLSQPDLNYISESSFSGIDSFCRVCAAYRVLVDATSLMFDCGKVSGDGLHEQFLKKFNAFSTETCFVTKCRLLLELFKIQIVAAAVYYN